MNALSQASSSEKNERLVAGEILEAWLNEGSFPDHLLERVDTSRAFIMEVVYGVVRQYRTLNWILDWLRGKNQVKEIRPHLLAGLYESVFMRDVATYAAVDETVTIIKKRWGKTAANFANALLRNALRKEEDWRRDLARQSIGIRLSHPDVLFDRWVHAYGEEQTVRLCNWNNTRAFPIIHVNRERVTMGDFLSAASEQGMACHEVAGGFLHLETGTRIPDLPGYDEGWFSVQDPATMAAVDLLNPQPGETVLDGCAAPGGKTMLMAERMKNAGRLLAVEPQARRVRRLRENLERMRLDFVEVRQADLCTMPREPDFLFDAILLDVPCTNTGVIRRRVDSRWRFTMERLFEVAKLQERILTQGYSLLRPGGRLVYSTCSLEREENEGLIERWRDAYPNAIQGDTRRCFPPDSESDGAFAALITKPS